MRERKGWQGPSLYKNRHLDMVLGPKRVCNEIGVRPETWTWVGVGAVGRWYYYLRLPKLYEFNQISIPWHFNPKKTSNTSLPNRVW